jgi:hypothetical protein
MNPTRNVVARLHKGNQSQEIAKTQGAALQRLI